MYQTIHYRRKSLTNKSENPASRKGGNTLTMEQIARLKPIARRYRLKSIAKSKARRNLINAKAAMAQQQTLSNFNSGSTQWEFSVTNVETFMYPSLAYEESPTEPKPATRALWKAEPVYSIPQSQYPHTEHLRMDEAQRKRRAFDAKLEFAERLMRQQVRSPNECPLNLR